MELTVKKENVLKAAAGCPNVRDVLEQLFPEAFEEEEDTKLVDFRDFEIDATVFNPCFIGVGMARRGQTYRVLLPRRGYKWELIENYWENRNAVVLRKI